MASAEEARSDHNALTAFVVENADLEKLEALLSQFNIFEAIGIVRQELRHSDFLAFLLDPRENHSLGDAFAKRLLQRVLTDAEDVSVPITPIDLDVWNLDQMVVLREWQRIDVLLLDESHRLAIIIENKIGTGEHSNQLRRYHRIVQQHYPDWRVIGLYLTPGGDPPSHEAYLPIDYGLVCDVLDGLVEGRASVVNLDLRILMTHYIQMLRRHIVGDSETARLCRQIYQKHQRALDLIYEHRPDTQAEIKDVLKGLINDEPGLELDSGKTKPRFAIRAWDTPALLTASGWTRFKRVLLFEFWNDPGNLQLALVIGPGAEETRQKLFEMARANPDVFNVPRNLAGKWNLIFSRPFLEQGMYEDATDNEREKEIRKRWGEFLEEDLPRIDAALKEERWLWQHRGGIDETT